MIDRRVPACETRSVLRAQRGHCSPILLGALLAASACGAPRERVLIGPMWTRECPTSDGTAVFRQTRQVGPLIEVGGQTTIGAGYLDRWMLIGGDRETSSVVPESSQTADRPRRDCPWTFELVRHEPGGDGDEVFVSRTEAGVMWGVGRDLLGLNIGFNRTTAVRAPDDSWFVLNAYSADPPSSTLLVHRAEANALDRETKGDK